MAQGTVGGNSFSEVERIDITTGAGNDTLDFTGLSGISGFATTSNSGVGNDSIIGSSVRDLFNY
ncbi:MAG: hypothetical protein QNJ70_23515 [Xenococcaceae cyanobacterium MO_207.B15]|nr:hypothetical protein [Xenococcaceae cyanobacterium MO_207.B15]